MELAAMCGSDVHTFHGATLRQRPFPLILGHENVGIVTALGEGVDHDYVGNSLAVGDRVIPWQYAPCGACYFCRIIQDPIHCRDRKALGFSYLANQEPHFTGGFGEYLYPPSPRYPIFKTTLTPDRAALAIPCHEGLNTAETAMIRRGEQVVVQGVGMQGLMCIVWARKMGATNIVAIGAPAVRLEKARELGAACTIDLAEATDSDERIRLVREMTHGGHGADVVLQCSGAKAALSEGLAFLREGGRMVDVGHISDVGSWSLDVPRELILRDVDLLAGWGASPEKLWQAIRLLETDEFDWNGLITHRLPLERVQDGLEAMAGNYVLDGREVVRVVIDPSMRKDEPAIMPRAAPSR